MTVTIETNGLQELEQLMQMLQTLKLKHIKIQPSEAVELRPTITKGDKKIDPTELFGIWKDNPRTLEQIREMAWKRN
jgi:hypothetical protein